MSEDNKKNETTEIVQETKPEVKVEVPKTEDPKIETKTTEEVVAAPKVTPTTPVKKQVYRKPQRNNNRRRQRRNTEFEETVIDIARVTTVVKGGRRFSFSAFVVVGNKKGKVGWGHGKAKEVPDAIKKAIKDSKNHMIVTPIIDKRTVPHQQIGKFLSSEILVKPAPKGKGVIASGAIRSVVELAGYHDIYTKSLGSRTKTNSVKAVINALSQLRTIEEIAKLRDIKVEDIRG
ncbi:30S ribosomal protein S5 [Candidatus Mycoplasma mahonii]|uniref:30S ribosomal protein S5 n=1 Tax=Candidatus Mycoplasma mahonii TaxID=3004105 RepID=UPI00402B3846